MELEEASVINPAYSQYSSPVWPVKKPDGFCSMTGDYQEVKNVVPLLHVAMPIVMDIMN